MVGSLARTMRSTVCVCISQPENLSLCRTHFVSKWTLNYFGIENEVCLECHSLECWTFIHTHHTSDDDDAAKQICHGKMMKLNMDNQNQIIKILVAKSNQLTNENQGVQKRRFCLCLRMSKVLMVMTLMMHNVWSFWWHPFFFFVLSICEIKSVGKSLIVFNIFKP